MSSNTLPATQKRWLTASTSKLAKVDVLTMLRKEEAWILLPEDTRQRLYSMLPVPLEGEASHDINVHPLRTRYKQYIEGELRKWQEDLGDGKEAKKWREEAIKAGSDRISGKWAEWMKQHGSPDGEA